jgi:hypothetical protein
MNLAHLVQPKRLVKELSTLALVATALVLGSTSVFAQATCRTVSGHFHEQAVSGPSCTSPFGLCIEAAYTTGTLHGTFLGSVNELIPSADTPVTNVLFFTTDTLIHAELEGKQGDIFVKNNGAFRTVGEGAIMDIQYITGGTGDFTGASGVLQAFGKFDSATGMGESDYIGTICLP